MTRYVIEGARLALVASAVGCGAGAGSPIIPDGPDATGVTGFDVLVGADAVVVYATYDDACHANNNTVVTFASPGTCADRDDAGFQCPACLRSISVDGVIGRSTAIAGFDNPFVVNVAATASSVLAVTGCNESIEVPLHATGLPAATITNIAHTEAAGVLISWTPDTVPSSLVNLFERPFGLIGTCHVSYASRYAFEYFGAQARNLSVTVQPLLPVETTQTALGPVRVWRGRESSIAEVPDVVPCDEPTCSVAEPSNN